MMSRKAFTLLEILVATAVLAIMVVLLSSVVGHVSKTWQEVAAENQRRSSARILLYYMARELQSVCLPLPMPANERRMPNLQMLGSVSDNGANATEVPANHLNPHALFWQVPLAQKATRGNIAEVGYFIRWVANGTSVRPVMCRFVSHPSDTADFQIYTASANGEAMNWLEPIDTVAPVTSPDYKGWLSDNVIALWIRYLDTNGKPIVETATGLRLNQGYGFDSNQGYRSPSTGEIHPAPAVPPCIEIALVVVDSRTLEHISGVLSAATTTPDDFDKDATTPGSVRYFVEHLPQKIKSGARIFSTRVYLSSSKK